MLQRKSNLSHRPKTSSAVDDGPGPQRFDTSMKRRASQLFHPHVHDVRDTGPPALGSVQEGTKVLRYSPHNVGECLEGAVAGVKQFYRRYSTSSKRPSNLDLGPMKMRKSSHESNSTDATLPEQSQPQPQTQTKSSMMRRLSSIRHRRSATSGPSGDTARFNPVPPQIPANYANPLSIPADSSRGSAARAAAAAQNERLSLTKQAKREAEMTARFLSDGANSVCPDIVTKDSESGIGMTYSSPVEGTNNALEKKLDPIEYLPAELSSIILSNLDARTLARVETLSKTWQAAASSPHVWRVVFLRKFEQEVHVFPKPIVMGGAGIGKITGNRIIPGQDWKKMYQVRKTIDRRWEANSPMPIYLNGHTDSVYCCQFDENKIITGSRDRTIRVWDLNTFQCLKVIGGPDNRPVLPTSAPLETHKDTVSNILSLNGTPEGRAIYHVPSDYHEASILCLQFDSEIMVTGSSDHTCIVWDITQEEYVPKYRLRRHSAGVLDVCLDDKYIISCSKDATINVWDRNTGDHIRELTGHRGPVNAVQLRGNLLVSASGDGVAKLWNLDSGLFIKEFPSQDRGLAAVEFSDDAKYVLAGGNDHVVYKFDTTTGQLLHTSTRHGGLVRSLFLDAHNGRVISGSYDQSIRISHYDSGETFGTYENWTTSWILSAKSDYRRVVATSQDGRALILDFGWGVDGVDVLAGK
ncbi:WD40 repeat-like protein [Cenococcum geophilum 1.58]|uniref:WD40 repeat-like protein n=1 Tax=Cenococcum geophilum 1.58 TaxID=794803 RepID=UPI00358EC049|nr:WD40 repeat-like protein [Cenococcum geophilum 1.58]